MSLWVTILLFLLSLALSIIASLVLARNLDKGRGLGDNLSYRFFCPLVATGDDNWCCCPDDHSKRSLTLEWVSSDCILFCICGNYYCHRIETL